MALSIRQATEADLGPLCALLDRYYTEWDIWQRDPPEAVRAAIDYPGLGYFIAVGEAALAGCVLLRPLPSIPRAAECKRLFIAPEFRGHGLAAALMDAAETAAHVAGLHWIYLDSKPEFTTAIALYRRRGYTEIPRFNDNAQATIFLRKSLAPE
jgi:GNAT superfamily N-acetyltransferase